MARERRMARGPDGRFVLSKKPHELRKRKWTGGSVRPTDGGAIPLHDEMFLQPWFIPRETYATLRTLLPSVTLLKMRYYFQDYGCIRCGRFEVLYGSNGFCERCSGLIRARTIRAMQRRLKQAGVACDARATTIFTDRMADAERLLAGLLPKPKIRTQSRG